MKEPGRYRKENDIFCIDIFLTSILQLFDRRDPSPFKEKDLDEDFSRYLILAMRELGPVKQVKLVIKMQDHHPNFLGPREIEEAITNFYSFESDSLKNEMRLLFMQGRTALIFGFAFLAVCYAGYYFTKEQQSLWLGVLGEGMHVLGWVALWKPLNIFLYEWWPIQDRMKLMNQLRNLKVELVAEKKE